jgi:dihydropyrimidine dehydrogenase (NAD+) subunit PreA
MVARAFDAGWGGVVWKTVGEQITNVTSRLGSLNFDGRRIVGMSNIELISDRPPEVNFAEIAEIKRRYPNQAVVVSLMVESKAETWYDFVGRVNDTGADGIELNFGCPHGMSERGMGAAVGQVPEYVQMITEWVMEKTAVPVLVKLTPNVTDIRPPARAARAGGANGIALINTVSSLIGVNLDTWAPVPDVRGKGSHGGFSGPAVKPIALNMTSAVASDPDVRLPISAIGGIADWHDAVEFMLVGATTVQVGTSVMHWGYRLIDDLVDGMSTYLRSKGLHSPAELIGKSLPTLTDWGHLDQSFRLLAQIDDSTCIHCNLCYAACNDGAHQAIRLEGTNGSSRLSVDGDYCVGCRLCAYVCPVDGCIRFEELEGAAAVH